MRLTILGCGTSTGVPVIGCHCSVCTSTNPRNRRTRASVLVTVRHRNILIDTSTDLREQSLANNIERIDAVLFTHPHADHIHGIDDLRAFNLLQKGAIPCYGSEQTLRRIRNIFEYIFVDDENDGWKPSLITHTINSPFNLYDIEIIPLDVYHGRNIITGFRIDSIAYITDCSGIPEDSLNELMGLDVLVISALRHKPHPSHFSIKEAIEVSEHLKPRRTILTHLSHSVDYERDSKALPPSVELAYDGMEISVDG